MQYYLTSIEPEKNRYRFYSISVQNGLFGNYYLVRKWGRIGTAGCTKTEQFDTVEEIEKSIEKLLELRKRHGYIDKTVS